MSTIKSYTDLEQSKKLSELLPLESVDMVLPFRHTKKDEYIPGYVVSRNYVEVYNEMMELSEIGKEDVCQLIQPCWSLAALLGVLPDYTLQDNPDGTVFVVSEKEKPMMSDAYDNPVDACVDMIEKLHELKML